MSGPAPLEAVVADLAARLAAVEATLAAAAARKAVEAHVRALTRLGYPEKIARRMAAATPAGAVAEACADLGDAGACL